MLSRLKRTAAGRRVKRVAAATAATAVMATGLVAVTSPAHASTNVSFSFTKHKDGSGEILIQRNGVAGAVKWAADPGSLPLWIDKGDTLYVSDQYSDGYAIRGEVVHAAGTPKYYRSASTSGHKAPYSVQKTENVAEGRKLQLRACMLQGSKVIQCSPYYAIHA
ncbi:hypothetical protein [Streptomyces sp. NPDC047928]|uniref:hypothetical protein n=1 Tax=unclassified Streptomyces TaxID=2593676 RepID=UPI00372352D4